ncbi:MAG: crosslink repair DNA glycosylase YcaQ family protein [Eubacteriales bacterium]
MINLTKCQAQQFMLLKHGLLGEYKFIGKQGVIDFIDQTSCIQFDPVDICGKNAELTLQSRVKGFTKDMLDELLYKDRKLFDNYDKCLCINSIKDWSYFERYRKSARESGLSSELLDPPEWSEQLKNQARSYICENGSINSSELTLKGRLRWSGGYNGTSNVTRLVLDYMCSTGEMIIHHKKGTRKYYDLAEKHIPAQLLNAADPLLNEFDHLKWRVLRRIGAIGLLWNRSSDAWLYIHDLWKASSKNENRNEVFRVLSDEGNIIAVVVEGLKDVLYCCASDMQLIEEVLRNPEPKPRCELIAPLDPFIWDRKLIKSLFDFEYTWEIYTPDHKRKYGVYVLPILWGERFIGRIEAICDRKDYSLIIKNIWYEDGVKQTKNLKTTVYKCLKRFAKFNGCNNISDTI